MSLAINGINNNIYRLQYLHLAVPQTKSYQASQSSQANANVNVANLVNAIKKYENSETHKEVRDIEETAITGLITGGPVGAAGAVAKKLAGIKKINEIGKDMVEEANSKETKPIWSDFKDAGKGFADDLKNSGKMNIDQAIVKGLKTPARFGAATCKTAARTATVITKNVIGEKTAQLGAKTVEFAGTVYESAKTVVKQTVHSGIDAGKGAFKALGGLIKGDTKAMKSGLQQVAKAGEEFANGCKKVGVEIYNKGKEALDATYEWGKKVGKGAARELKAFAKDPIGTGKKWGKAIVNRGKKIGKGIKKFFTGK